VDIDTIYQRAIDLLLVAGDGHGGTTAFFHRIAVISARAPVRVAVGVKSMYVLILNALFFDSDTLFYL
jgi:hypothetical protein